MFELNKKGLEPIISVLLLIVVSVILIIIILNFGQDKTLTSLNKTETVIKQTDFEDLEYFIYNKKYNTGAIQFTYLPPKTNIKEVNIIQYKVLYGVNETEIITLDSPFLIKEGANLLRIGDLNINTNKFDLILISDKNQFITLKDIIFNINNVSNLTETYYNVLYLSDENGKIEGDYNQMVLKGRDGVEVTAIPNQGYYFVDWNDSSTLNPRQDVSVNSDLTVLANFAISKYLVSITFSGEEGRVYSIPEGLDCTTDCNYLFDYGTDINLIAEPSENSIFVNWEGNECDTNELCILNNIDNNVSLSVEFAIKPEHFYSANGRLYFTSNFLKSNLVTLTGYRLKDYSTNFIPIEMIDPLNLDRTLNSVELRPCYQWVDWSKDCTPYIDLGIIEDDNASFSVEFQSSGGLISIDNIISENNNGPTNCSDGYIPVPGNYLYGTMNDNNGFCVMKYEAKYLAGSGSDGESPECVTGEEDYTLVTTSVQSIYSDSPLSAINLCAAKQICANSNGRLINNNEWMTIARNIERVSNNWYSSQNKFYIGHTDNNPSNSLPAGPNDSTDGLIYTNGSGSYDTAQRRTFYLTNSEVLWDFSGNMIEWTDNTIFVKDHPDAYNSNGTENNAGWTGGWIQYYNKDSIRRLNYNALGNTSMLYKDLFLLKPTYNSDNGIGAGRFFSDRSSTSETITGYLRGGSWAFTTDSGILSLTLSTFPKDRLSSYGLRCVMGDNTNEIKVPKK